MARINLRFYQYDMKWCFHVTEASSRTQFGAIVWNTFFALSRVQFSYPAVSLVRFFSEQKGRSRLDEL